MCFTFLFWEMFILCSFMLVDILSILVYVITGNNSDLSWWCLVNIIVTNIMILIFFILVHNKNHLIAQNSGKATIAQAYCLVVCFGYISSIIGICLQIPGIIFLINYPCKWDNLSICCLTLIITLLVEYMGQILLISLNYIHY